VSIARRADVAAALARLKTDNAWTLAQQIAVCEIPAPPFKEAARAADVRRRFEQLGLRNVRIDSIGNVIGERPGVGKGPTVMLAGHLDTVFPEGTDVRVKRTGTKLSAPGISDDCRGLAVLLAVARAMELAKVRTAGTVLFVADVGEDGPGNLRGARYLYRDGAPRPDYFISVDGAGTSITSRAVGSRRFRVTYKGPGGHSYGAFGMPNPIHALGRAIAAISNIQVPTTPKTTFNVGVISGGTSVNSISASASMDVDLRSESPAALDSLTSRFRDAVDGALAAENARWPASATRLTVDVEDVGLRPAGGQPDSAPIVQTALAAARSLGFTSKTGASSTDANIPMSLGLPAITIDGGGTSEGAHSLGEWYDDGTTGFLGPQWALLILMALAPDG
jgi:acetylornithine deacetylase/succinyl-diaminopimelate desuccinylase-like protein